MAVNEIQMQPGLSLSAFLASHGPEAQCEAALVNWHWPQGFVCPRCGGSHAHTFRRRDQPYSASTPLATSLIGSTGSTGASR